MGGRASVVIGEGMSGSASPHKPSSPAARLLTLLQDAMKIGPNVRSEDAWRTVLDVDNGDVSLLLDRLGPLMRLPQEVRAAVVELGDKVSPELLLRWVPQVERSFASTNLDVPWDHFRKNLSRDTLLAVEFCADQLQRLAPEQVIDEDEIAGFLTRVRELQDEVSASTELDEELRQFLMRHLRALEYALQDYRFRGTPALRDAVAMAVGESILRTDLHSRIRSSNVASRVWTLVKTLAQVLAFAANVAQITDTVHTLWLEAPEPTITTPAPPDVHEGEIVDGGELV